MGSEWSEANIGPQGPAGAPGGTYMFSSIGESGNTVYSGTAEALVTGAAVSGSILAGFRYRTSAYVPVRSTVGGDIAELRWRIGGIGGAVIARQRVHLPASGVDFYAHVAGMYDHVSGDGLATFFLTCARYSGSGTVVIAVSSSARAFLELQEARTSSFGNF